MISPPPSAENEGERQASPGPSYPFGSYLIAAAPAAFRARRALPADAAAIEAMMRAMASESPIYREMKIDDARLAGFIRTTIVSPQHFVALHEGLSGLDGLFVGMLVQQFFTLEFTAMDVLFYVRPERRGSRAAVRLFRAFKVWAEACGATAIQTGAMTGIDLARTARFYRGMGLKEIGGVYHGPAK